jgi:hypothetical protein
MRSSHRGSGAYNDAVLVEKANQGAGRGKKAVFAPWHKRATANARRLRRKT